MNRILTLACIALASSALTLSAVGCDDDGDGGEGGSAGAPSTTTSTAPTGPTTGSGGTGGMSGSGGSSGVGGSGGSGSGGSGSGGGMMSGEPAAMQGMTAAHNAERASVNPPANPPIPPLTWSSQVAAAAQAYAEQCVFQHSGNGYGENIYATSGSATPQDVVASWAAEKANYNYANNSCSGVCGHYTQVVWADSLNLGCGVANCNQNSPFGGGSWQFWVCNYDPPGNFGGQRPY